MHWHKAGIGLLRHRGTDRNNNMLAGVRECDRLAIVLNPEPDEHSWRISSLDLGAEVSAGSPVVSASAAT